MFTIGQVMNRQVRSLEPTTTVADAIRFLTKNHTGGVPVTSSDGALVGMVSELALIDVVFDEAVQHVPISSYMTAELHSVRPDEPLSRAAQLFTLYAFRRLPVVDNGKLVGILTRRDLMNHALHSRCTLSDPLLEIFPALVSAKPMDALPPAPEKCQVTTWE